MVGIEREAIGLVANKIVHVCQMTNRVVVEAALVKEIIHYNVFFVYLFWSIDV